MTLPLDYLSSHFMPFLLNYWLTTQHPVIRLPVFFMGICVGILCTRSKQGDFDAFQRLGRWSGNSILSFIEDTSLPFPFFHKVNQKIMQKCDIEARTKSWIRRVDLNVKAYFVVLGIFSVLNIIYACLGY